MKKLALNFYDILIVIINLIYLYPSSHMLKMLFFIYYNIYIFAFQLVDEEKSITTSVSKLR